MISGLTEQTVYLYFILAIGYNVISQVRADVMKKALAPTEPSFGILMMTVLFLVWHAEPILPPVAQQSLLILFILLIARFGIARHLTSYSPEAYSSKLSWGAAIGINIFGACVLTIHSFLG